MNKPLTKGQEEASIGFFDFLLSDDKFMIIDGPGGVGKTFLMGHLINKVMDNYRNTCKLLSIPCKYEKVVMTATTNKAADVLSNNIGISAQTIHSFLKLRIFDDYQTGETKVVKANDWDVHSNIILFIDEASMIDRQLWEAINDSTFNSKVIFVGDEYQLGPIKEVISPIYRQDYLTFRLTEPVRNAGQPELIKICQQMRDTVITGNFKPIQPIRGIIDHFGPNEMEQAICQDFAQQVDDRRILAYSNIVVQNYNDFVREIRNLPKEFTVGEHLVNNSAIEVGNKMRLSIEEEVVITEIDGKTEEHTFPDGGNFFFNRMTLKTTLGAIAEVKVPSDRDHFINLMKYYKNKKMWVQYFHLKNQYPDLRPKDAATVHKAQGSTYHTVYIDMANLSRCNQPEQASRLLNVAVSRPTNRIVMYGDLAEKYGGILPYESSC